MIAGHSFVESIVGLIQLAPGWEDQNRWALLVAALIVIAQAAAALWGGVTDEDEVRPGYAREIHERLQLESEVEAAKEAQLRLLPAGPPDIPGVTLSASCRATEKVSGDFYDFFPISRTKVGVLVCDGGGNGLATALTIALAKGYLMHKAQCTFTPLETLRGLESTLGEQLKGISAEGICYFIVDAEEGTVRYARYGDTPSMLLAGGGELSHETQHLGSLAPLWEASAKLTAESRLIIYTNGLSRLVGEPDRPATNRWLLKRIGGLLWQPAGAVHDAIVKAIFSRRGRKGSRKASDDVTVIVCSIDRQAARGMEQVA
jgi:sigma-B regulation protein RsbU (phosphoserine phosphatase)